MNKSFLLFSFITFLFLASCSSPEAPEFQKLENVKFKSASITNLLNFTLTADAIFMNNNPVGGNLTGLDLEVFINDKKVSDVKQNVTASISGNSDFKLPLEIEVPMTEVLKDIKPTLGDILKSQEVNYRIKGTASVSMAGVEVDIPVDYADKEEIKLSTDVPLINFGK